MIGDKESIIKSIVKNGRINIERKLLKRKNAGANIKGVTFTPVTQCVDCTFMVKLGNDRFCCMGDSIKLMDKQVGCLGGYNIKRN